MAENLTNFLSRKEKKKKKKNEHEDKTTMKSLREEERNRLCKSKRASRN
jgi:hypothetical protein